MLDQSKLDLSSLETYKASCIEIAAERLAGFKSMNDIEAAAVELNAYDHLNALSEPRDLKLLDVETIDAEDLDKARKAVLEGLIFWEHTAAGEATRLKMGTKFLINIAREISIQNMTDSLKDELGRDVLLEEVWKQLNVEPERLLPLNLGARHLAQLSFDLYRLAEKAEVNPESVLNRQVNLLILNEKTARQIVQQVVRDNFYGFNRNNFYFMIQASFHGITLKDGMFVFDYDSPKRLHNHGQLAMQETMDGQVFQLDENGRRIYLDSKDFGGVLSGFLDKISYNIEDLDYLTSSIDWPSMALALKLGREGYKMVMEIVANNPERPQKGGLAAFDEILGRNVMIESFQLKNMPNSEIKFLNKNFNHYTDPATSWRAVKNNKLPMPISVKDGLLYYQPVQGDINFLVKTAFVSRKKLKPIRAWKSASNTPTAVNAMWIQDNQPGFRRFFEKYASSD